MNLTLRRKLYTNRSTIGALYIEDIFECYTLERSALTSYTTLIPCAILRGTYEVQILPSERFGKLMPRLLNVPHHEGILIHPGNTPEDTEGCILVGKIHNTGQADYIGESRQAFGSLFEKIKTARNQSQKVMLQILEEATGTKAQGPYSGT